MSCCQTQYDHKFNLQRAKEELQNYLDGKMRKNSRLLVNMLKELPLKEKSLLDIGAGIGTIIFELFPRGLRQVTYNEISEAYLKAFFRKQSIGILQIGSKL